MSIVTYYSKEEIEKYRVSSDKDINDLLSEVNAKLDNPFFVREFEHSKPRLLRSPKVTMSFSLYKQIDGEEVQVLNFAQDYDWSINTTVAKSYILTYLYGVLAGLFMPKNK